MPKRQPKKQPKPSSPAFRVSVDPEFRALIPPLSTEERASLEASIRKYGVRDKIRTWRGLIVDGHNRHEIADALALPFNVEALDDLLPTREAVLDWMLDHQRSRRSLTPHQMVVLALTRGQDPGRTVSRHTVEEASAAIAAGYSADILAGRLTLRQAVNRMRPRAPRGPTEKPHVVPNGHELAGLSTLRDADGTPKASWDKTRIAGADAPPVDVPESHLIKQTATFRRGDGTTVAQWVTTSADDQRRENAFREAWARHAELYRGLADPALTPLGPELTDAECLTIYPLGDPHIGMLAWAPETGESFDTKIACRELLMCVRLMVSLAPRSKHAIVCNLGDFMHAQDDLAQTPGHGHRLDVDGRFAKSLDMGHVLLRGIVDTLLTKHEIVYVRNLPGNHDPRVAAELAMWLKAVYENNPRVVIHDPYAPHQYDRHGVTLIGWHHGDRAKPADLPALMAEDQRELWGQTTEHVWHTGHVHHLTRKESPGCIVETHRTMAARDAYHAGKYRAGRSLQAITYHARYGECARATVGLKRVRDAIAAEGSAAHE